MLRVMVIGVVAGWLFWGALFLVGYFYTTIDELLPDWIRSVPDMIATACMIAALPVVVGGWVFVWGDGPQPPAWVTSTPFNVAVGLFLYGVLGAVVAIKYERRRKRQRLDSV